MIELVRQANARRPIVLVRFDNVLRNTVLSRNQQFLLIHVKHRDFIVRAEERRGILVAQAQVQRKFVRDLPVVLHEKAVLVVPQVRAAKAAPVVAGGGVVADSVPALEYQESVNKSRAILTAIEMAEGGLE